jgi:hypothetical protein
MNSQHAKIFALIFCAATTAVQADSFLITNQRTGSLFMDVPTPQVDAEPVTITKKTIQDYVKSCTNAVAEIGQYTLTETVTIGQPSKNHFIITVASDAIKRMDYTKAGNCTVQTPTITRDGFMTRLDIGAEKASITELKQLGALNGQTLEITRRK